MADKVAAKKMAAEMQRRQLQKDFLSREEALDKETIRTVKEKWFEILLRSKLPEMKENLRSVLDYMEKLVEVEVFRKRLFEEERNEASDQLNVQAHSHSSALDNIYDLYLQRIRDLHSIYEKEVLKKKESAESEFEKIKERERKAEENLKAVLYQMEMNQEKKEDSMRCEMFLKMDDEKCKNAEKSENLRIRLERLMERRWYQISSVLVDYQQTTEPRRNHYAQLKARDKHDSKIIHSQMKKTQKLYDQIQQLKNSLENRSSTDEKEVLISDYRQERLKFYGSFIYLKKVMMDEMRLDDSHLKELTATSRDILDYLNHFFKKGEKVLTLFSLCLKLETEKEKIVPVGRTLYTTKVPDHLVNQVKSQHHMNELSTVNHDIHKASMLDEFQNFWQKYGKVRLSIASLSQCITNIKHENEVLKKILHSYVNQVTARN